MRATFTSALPALLAPLLLAACSVGAREARAPRRASADSARLAPGDTVALVRQAIMEADREFARATAERGVEGWLAYFETNGSQVNGGGTVTTGLPAIRALMAPTLGDPALRLRWAPTDAVVGPSARLGSTVGRWELIRRDSSGTERVASRGSYLTVWRRQADGRWKIVADVGSPD